MMRTPQTVAMYREFNELSASDRQAIKAMMDHLKKRNVQGET